MGVFDGDFAKLRRVVGAVYADVDVVVRVDAVDSIHGSSDPSDPTQSVIVLRSKESIPVRGTVEEVLEQLEESTPSRSPAGQKRYWDRFRERDAAAARIGPATTLSGSVFGPDEYEDGETGWTFSAPEFAGGPAGVGDAEDDELHSLHVERLRLLMNHENPEVADYAKAQLAAELTDDGADSPFAEEAARLLAKLSEEQRAIVNEALDVTRDEAG